MFSEAEQIKLQSFLSDLEKDDSPPPSSSYNARNSESSSSTTKRKNEKSRMKPYSKGNKSKSSSSGTHKSNSDSSSTPIKTGRARKPPHELLSEDQKKANHIASEQKRRANIRIGFDQLVDMVPALDSCHRSESLILQKSVDYIRELIKDKDELKERARKLQTALGEVPDEDSSEGEMEYYR